MKNILRVVLIDIKGRLKKWGELIAALYSVFLGTLIIYELFLLILKKLLLEHIIFKDVVLTITIPLICISMLLSTIISKMLWRLAEDVRDCLKYIEENADVNFEEAWKKIRSEDIIN